MTDRDYKKILSEKGMQSMGDPLSFEGMDFNNRADMNLSLLKNY